MKTQTQLILTLPNGKETQLSFDAFKARLKRGTVPASAVVRVVGATGAYFILEAVESAESAKQLFAKLRSDAARIAKQEFLDWQAEQRVQEIQAETQAETEPKPEAIVESPKLPGSFEIVRPWNNTPPVRLVNPSRIVRLRLSDKTRTGRGLSPQKPKTVKVNRHKSCFGRAF